MILSFLKRYILVINLVLLAALAYVFAQIVNDNIKERLSPPLYETAVSSNSISTEENNINGKSGLASSRSSYDVIADRNIFGLKSTSGLSRLNPNEVPRTTLNLELLGTVVRPGEKSKAVIKNLDTGKIRGYAEGQSVDIIESENVKLSRIESCIAVVERSEGPETIRCKKDDDGNSSTVLKSGRTNLSSISEMLERRESTLGQSENEGVREVSGGIYEIDQDMLNELLSDPNQLVTQARVIPQEDGLRFFAIRPNSVFFKIGIRNGDILNKINDVELGNVENALKLFEELRGETNFTVDITRRGQKLSYQYVVK